MDCSGGGCLRSLLVHTDLALLMESLLCIELMFLERAAVILPVCSLPPFLPSSHKDLLSGWTNPVFQMSHDFTELPVLIKSPFPDFAISSQFSLPHGVFTA